MNNYINIKNIKNIKNTTLSIRCNEKEKELINEKAEKAGMSLSAFTLKSALMSSESLEKKVKKRKKGIKICRIQTMLNELPPSPLIEKILMEVEELWNL